MTRSETPTPLQPLEVRGFHFYEAGSKWTAKGITYGPFKPGTGGAPYPIGERLERDMQDIARAGANVVRVYTAPTPMLVDATVRHGLRLMVDIPWPKHIDVYGKANLEDLCFWAVDESAEALRHCPNLMGVLLGNEIPPDLVRWEGPARVEDFLRRLLAHARERIPGVPIGFSNFPSTEYLSLGFFDFLGFNVYLQSDVDLRAYLLRLRHLYPDIPLILTETGLDSLRNGEEAQEQLIVSSLRSAYETGFAGAFVFSWTDEWHTGGHDICDWRFGIVDKERRPKRAYYGLQTFFQHVPQVTLPQSLPKASVVVATYNGAATLRQCLLSLGQLNYPNYEVIVVDDGSTDDTGTILQDFPSMRVIRQENRGLSNARNAGIEASAGEIVAFTDADCYVDKDWLYHLAMTLLSGRYSAAGGPNLTPWEPNPVHRCVALAPGHATHVLLNGDEAEHVPGCNMAFWRTALLKVGSFDPIYRTAGDDVDVMWRLQDAGMHVGFSPAAFVWHHRRSTIRAYWRQQYGYGEAEAMLIPKHPHRFNDQGQSIWRGRIYTGPETASLFQPPDIHYGMFGAAGFQCIYERPEGRLVTLASSFEWWSLCLVLVACGVFAWMALAAGILGLCLSLALTGMKARRRFRTKHDVPPNYFLVVWFLWQTQPLVRGWARYRSRVLGLRPSARFLREMGGGSFGAARAEDPVREYWGEHSVPRVDFVQRVSDYMRRNEWIFRPGSAWEPFDLLVLISWFHHVRIVTAAEDHGAGRLLLRIRTSLVASRLTWFAVAGGILVTALLAFHDTVVARVVLVCLIIAGWMLYRSARRRRAVIQQVLESLAAEAGFRPLAEHHGKQTSSTPPRDPAPPELDPAAVRGAARQ